MAIIGVNNNALELLFSTDKNIQDFLATVKAGDLIRGKVVDVIQGDNKAIINFKGYNIISELPQGATLKPGDIINAQVSQVNDQIFMKLIANTSASEIGRGMDITSDQSVTSQQIINMLNELKVPVNEQNIFIAQKLMDYHLPVTAQNIKDVNSALKNYLDAKGIDISATNIETPQAAKLIVLNNMFRLNNEAVLLSARDQQELQQTQASSTALQQTQQQSLMESMNRQVQQQSITQQQSEGQQQAITQQQSEDQQQVTNQKQALQEAATGQQTEDQPDVSQQNTLQSMINDIIQGTAQQPGPALSFTGQGQIPQVILPQTVSPAIQSPSATRLLNIMDTVGNVASASRDIKISLEGNTITVNIKNGDADLVRNAAVLSLNEGNLSVTDAQTIVGALNSGAASSNVSGGVTLNRLNNGDIEVKFNALKDAIENISNAAAGQNGTSAQLLSSLKNAIIPKLMAVPENSPQLSFISAKPDIGNLLPQESKATLAQVRDTFAALQKSVTNPGDVNLQQNVNDIIAAISKLNEDLAALNNVPVTRQNTTGITAPATAQMEINRIFNNTTDLIKQINLPADTGNFEVPPAQYTAFNLAVKNFTDLNANSPVVKPPQVLDIKLPANIKVNPQVDVESTIESLAFLKSRNLPIDNSTFVDIMAKYFKDDMKLNQNMQGLSNAIDKFEEANNNAPVNPSTNAFISNISKMSTNIRSMMQQMSINTSDPDLKPQVMQSQIANLINKSGLNQENNLAKVLSQAAPGVDVDKLPQMINARNNLKAELIRLDNEITQTNTQKLSDPLQKETIQVMKDKAGDVLTNLNAIQFINQKPVSYEMLYAQLPILINNNFFNGELQVWYRKGSLKENMEKSMPVNLVFVLNTSNLGSVKISMTIYKKDVECNVTLENEKAKQVLMRGKNDFVKGLGTMSYNVKNFNLQLATDDDKGPAPDASGGYVNLGRINLKA